MTTNDDILNYEDPGKMDEELFQVPGMVNELMNVTLRNAPRPNRHTALMGALACVSHLAGRTYEDEHGTHANLYLVALAPTAMGKDEPRCTNQKLMEKIGTLESAPESVASPEGLEDALVESPALLLQNDEADSLFGAMSSSGLRSAKLNSTILKLYSQSRGVMLSRLKAGQHKRAVIEKPHLTLFATGVPEFVYKSLSAKALTDGLMGRCLFVESNEFCRLGEQVNEPLSGTLIKEAGWMMERERAFAKCGIYDPIIVKATPEAKARIEEMKLKADDIAEEALKREQFVASALLCRFCEKVLKLAMVAAISKDPHHPVITPEDITWAARFVTYATKQMLYRSCFYVGEGKFGKLKGRALAMLKRHGGTMSRSQFLQDLSVPFSTFKMLITTLIACELIEAESVSHGKVLYHLIKSK